MTRQINKSGHPTVDAIASINFQGNITPRSWYKHIRYANKRGIYTDTLAVAILSELVYWYRPEEIRDEMDLEKVTFKKRFKEDLLQFRYRHFCRVFGATKRQVEDSFDLLRSLNLIRTELRDSETKEGQKLNNVMYIDLITDRIAEISDKDTPSPEIRCSPPSHEINRESCTKSKGGVARNRGEDSHEIEGTNTKNTSTKITNTETTLEREECDATRSEVNEGVEQPQTVLEEEVSNCNNTVLEADLESRTPHSAAPPEISQQQNNASGNLTVISPIIPISDLFDLTYLGVDGMPRHIKDGLDEATKAREKKKYTYEVQNASKYLIGNLPKYYRKSKVILSTSPNDIDPRFKKYLFDQMKDAKEISEATNWIKAMELDPTRWEELSDQVCGFLSFLETGMTTKQAMREFDRQKNPSTSWWKNKEKATKW